jgi:exodeoxyribonuclease V gamma subunit
MGFDLLGEEHLEGDRTRKESDKYLFLDAVLSAREKLYLSYIGQSVKNNKEIPPSIVIDILEDYTGLEIKAVKHPLHGFSSAYGANDNRLFTYLYQDDERMFDPVDGQKKEFPELSVYSFVSFFQHPIEWYFETLLKIKFDEPDDILPENELFELDHLQQWLRKSELLRESDDSIQRYLLKGMKEGFLPLKNAGKVLLDELIQEIAGLKASYRALVNNRDEKNIVVDLTLKNIPVRGIIDSVYGDDFIAYTFSDNKKHLVAARLKTLLLSAAGKISSASFIDRYGLITAMEVPDQGAATATLETLMDYLISGSEAPLKFTLKAAVEAIKQTATPEKVFNAFKEEALGNKFSHTESNPYVRILFDEGYFNGINEDSIALIISLSGLLNLKNN